MHSGNLAVRHLDGVIARLLGTFPSSCLSPVPHTLPSQLLLQFCRPLSLPFPLLWGAAQAGYPAGHRHAIHIHISYFTRAPVHCHWKEQGFGKQFGGSKSRFFPHSICFFWKFTCNPLSLAAAWHDVVSLYKATQLQLLGLQIQLPGNSSHTGHFPLLRQHGSVPLSTHLSFWLCALLPLAALFLW